MPSYQQGQPNSNNPARQVSIMPPNGFQTKTEIADSILGTRTHQ